MICQHAQIHVFLDYELMRITVCDDCGLVFMKYLPVQAVGADLYSNYYKKNSAGRFSLMVESVVRFFRWNRARAIAGVFGRAKSILDIGSGRGFVLYYLKKYWSYTKAVGIQISEPARYFARVKLGLDIYDRDFLTIDFAQGKFEVITMLHVLEHVQQPEAYVQKIADTLTADGGFLVEVPNLRAWSRYLAGKYWLSWDPKYHLTFFNKRTLTALLKKYGFDIRSVNTFSWEYSIFTSAQSLASALTRTEHIFYRLLQGERFSWSLALVGSVAFVLMLIPSLIINLVLFFSDRGEVLRMVARK